jgi:tyrosyl-tRNA synthetase
MPLLVGTDGVEKMSKSLGNYIGINDPATEIYGKAMSIPDNMIINYFTLATEVSSDRLAAVKKELEAGDINPMKLKKELAFELVKIYHDKTAAEQAQLDFETKFSKREIPENISNFIYVSPLPYTEILNIVTATGITPSGSQDRRLITGGGVQWNKQKITDIHHQVSLEGDNIIKIGKLNYFKVIWKKENA